MLRRFRFNLPQRIAAALLALFLLQGFWLISRQTLTDSDYQYARCGRETWEKPSPLAGYYTSCGNIHDGILAYRLAGLPLTLNLLARARTRSLSQAQKIASCNNTGSELSTWELRHQMTHILLLLRLPFLFAGFVLGGCIWWVTRRLYGNLGGYTALALYASRPPCSRPASRPTLTFSPRWAFMAACTPASAWPTPCRDRRRKVASAHRPPHRIFGVAAAAHIVAPSRLRPCSASLAMLWVAEGHRSQALPVVLVAVARRARVCLRLLRLFARRIQLRLPFFCRASLRSPLIRRAASSARSPTAESPRRLRRPGPVSRRAQVALLRQHPSSALRFRLACCS